MLFALGNEGDSLHHTKRGFILEKKPDNKHKRWPQGRINNQAPPSVRVGVFFSPLII